MLQGIKKSALITFLFCCCVLLLCLGVWQLRRLNWKNNLLATINCNLHQKKLQSHSLLKKLIPPYENLRFMPIELMGKIDTSIAFKLMSKVNNGKLGYNLIIPIDIDKGFKVMLNLGWLDSKVDLSKITLTNKLIKIQGYLLTEDKPGYYTPQNNYQTKELFFINPSTIAQKFNMHTLLPIYVIRANEISDLDKKIKLPQIDLNLRNFHLQYAITWFLLSLICAIFIYIILHQKNSINN